MPENSNTDQKPQCVQTDVSSSALLKDKAFIDFEKWLKKQPISNFNNYTKNIVIHNKIYTELNVKFIESLIIDWLDSVEFYINIEVIKDKSSGYVRGFESDVTFIWHGDLKTINSDCLKNDIYETRAEATLKAIEKANEVYNAKFFKADC